MVNWTKGKFLGEPDLWSYGVVMVNEAHERTLSTLKQRIDYIIDEWKQLQILNLTFQRENTNNNYLLQN